MLPFWVTSLNKIFSISFHLLAKFMILIFFKAEYFFTVCVYYIFTINLLVEGNASCFPFWAIVNRIAMDITVKLWSRMESPLGILSKAMKLDCKVDLFLPFWVSFTLISIAAPICNPINIERWFASHAQHLFLVFNLGHSNWDKMKY